jgi:uncharacterized membrane protein
MIALMAQEEVILTWTYRQIWEKRKITMLSQKKKKMEEIIDKMNRTLIRQLNNAQTIIISLLISQAFQISLIKMKEMLFIVHLSMVGAHLERNLMEAIQEILLIILRVNLTLLLWDHHLLKLSNNLK